MLVDPCPVLDSLSEAHGATFALRVGPQTMAVVGEPDHVAGLLATSTDAFRWGHRFNTLGAYVGSTSMIVSDGADHRRRRGAVQPAFARRRLDAWVPMILARTDAFVDGLLEGPDAGEPIDLFPLGRRLVLGIVLEALFGPELAQRAAEIDELVEPAKVYLEQPALRQLPHPLPGTRRARMKAGRRGLDALVQGEIERRHRAGETERDDVLSMLLAAGPDGTGELSQSEILDQVVTLIGAGYDTTTSALAWTVLRAARAPEVWARLRAEADDASTYARAVMIESLRLHPPGVITPRQATRDVDVGPWTIPARSMILWSPYLAGRSATAWDRPLEFDPDRHLGSDDRAALVRRGAWVPFGSGPRACIGFALAEMELTLIISRLAQRLDVTLVGSSVPRPYGMVVNRPTGGVVATVTAAGG